MDLSLSQPRVEFSKLDLYGGTKHIMTHLPTKA